ncbi:MAG: DUF1180 domain-containing protein [Anaerolineae bacterium]|nr:DUF1180 domain-containing protein [Anaerolineae bacterium]
MRTTPRLLTFILLGLLLITLLALPAAFALAQETTTPTEATTVTEEAEATATEETTATEEATTTATEEAEAAEAGEGSTGEEASAAVESARETVSADDANQEAEAETDQPALPTMMMVIGFIAVVVTGAILIAKDRAAKDDVV